MPPPPSSPTVLITPLTTIKVLLGTFQTNLSSRPPPHNIENPPNALSLLHDASSLLHAQTTKLSLLLLNKPFTPSAIASILTSISSECLPGLMSVWELCDGRMYSSTLQNEVRMLLREMVAGLSSLVDHIPRDEEAVMGLEGSREEILKATGQVWQVCDRINKVAGSGIVGLAVEKVDAFHALVKDAVEEIEGWDPDEEEESLFGSDSSDLNQMGAANANGATNGEKHGAEDEPEPPALDGLQIKDMHVLKDRAVKVLKLIRMLYPALRKRRVSTFVHFDRSSDVESLPSQAKVETLDHILGCLKQFSEAIDEVAGSLYGGEAGEVDDKLETLKNTAEQCVGKVRLDWDGREDEFSIWSGKWIERVKETGQRA